MLYYQLVVYFKNIVERSENEFRCKRAAFRKQKSLAELKMFCICSFSDSEPPPRALLSALSGCNENDTDHLDRDQQAYPPTQKTKRMRTSFKHHQLRTMKSYFAINHNPDAKDLKQLAQKTGLTKRVLQVSREPFFLLIWSPHICVCTPLLLHVSLISHQYYHCHHYLFGFVYLVGPFSH